jgi:hypothetical protein
MIATVRLKGMTVKADLDKSSNSAGFGKREAFGSGHWH